MRTPPAGCWTRPSGARSARRERIAQRGALGEQDGGRGLRRVASDDHEDRARAPSRRRTPPCARRRGARPAMCRRARRRAPRDPRRGRRDRRASPPDADPCGAAAARRAADRARRASARPDRSRRSRACARRARAARATGRDRCARAVGAITARYRASSSSGVASSTIAYGTWASSSARMIAVCQRRAAIAAVSVPSSAAPPGPRPITSASTGVIGSSTPVAAPKRASARIRRARSGCARRSAGQSTSASVASSGGSTSRARAGRLRDRRAVVALALDGHEQVEAADARREQRQQVIALARRVVAARRAAGTTGRSRRRLRTRADRRCVADAARRAPAQLGEQRRGVYASMPTGPPIACWMRRRS